MVSDRLINLNEPSGPSGEAFARDVQDEIQSIWGKVVERLTSVSGTAKAYTATLTPAPTALADGMSFWFTPHRDSEPSPTLTINALAAAQIYADDGTSLPRGALKAGGLYLLTRKDGKLTAPTSGGVLPAFARELLAATDGDDAREVLEAQRRSYVLSILGRMLPVAYGVPYFVSKARAAVLGPGTSGQVLTSGGTGAAPTWTTGARSTLQFSTAAVTVAAGATRYFGTGQVSTATDVVTVTMTAAGTLDMLYASAEGSPGGAETFVYTVMKNGVATTITCTSSAGVRRSSDLTHSVTVAAGDQIDIRIVASAAATARAHQAMLRFRPS